MEVRLTPKNDEKVKVFRDDFQLHTDRDGEKSKPFAPSQIAGRGALIVTPSSDGRGGGLGIGLGGFGMGSGGDTVTNTSKMDKGSKNKENPILSVLNEKVLAEKEIDKPISGLLFFPWSPNRRSRICS